MQDLALRVAVRARHGEKDRQHLVERPSRRFQRLDCVGKCRLGRIIGNCVDFGAVCGQGLVERGREILVRNRIERGEVEGRGPVGEQRIRHAGSPMMVVQQDIDFL